ncbi:hypothetical protein FOZ62_015817, partial [Perkinsus olseni]
GEQFTVNVAPNSTPSCDCPAFVAAPDFCCEHLLFVYVQVLKLPAARQAVAEALKKPSIFEDIEREQNISGLHQQLAESSGTSGQFATLPGTAPALCSRCAPPIIRLVETNGT